MTNYAIAANDVPASELTIGIISDTHGLLRPEAMQALAGVDYILHAGDVGDAEILDRLRDIAPLTAIRGNIDTAGACAFLPATEMVELGGRLFYMVHSLDDLDIDPTAAGAAAVVSGHSHRAQLQERNGTLYLNPGSAGRAGSIFQSHWRWSASTTELFAHASSACISAGR